MIFIDLIYPLAACRLLLLACRSEFVSRTQPLPLVTAQYWAGFAEPRPKEEALTFWPRQATS